MNNLANSFFFSFGENRVSPNTYHYKLKDDMLYVTIDGKAKKIIFQFTMNYTSNVKEALPKRPCSTKKISHRLPPLNVAFSL